MELRNVSLGEVVEDVARGQAYLLQQHGVSKLAIVTGIGNDSEPDMRWLSAILW